MEAMNLPCMGSYSWPIHLVIDLKTLHHNRPFHFQRFWVQHRIFLAKLECCWKLIEVTGSSLMHEHIFQEKQRLEEEMEPLQTCIIQEGHNEQLVAKEGYQALLVCCLQALLVYELSRLPDPKSMYKDLVGIFR